MMNIEIDILSPDVFANGGNWLEKCLLNRTKYYCYRTIFGYFRTNFRKIEHITGKIIIFAVSKTWRI